MKTSLTAVTNLIQNMTFSRVQRRALKQSEEKAAQYTPGMSYDELREKYAQLFAVVIPTDIETGQRSDTELSQIERIPFIIEMESVATAAKALAEMHAKPIYDRVYADSLNKDFETITNEYTALKSEIDQLARANKPETFCHGYFGPPVYVGTLEGVIPSLPVVEKLAQYDAVKTRYDEMYKEARQTAYQAAYQTTIEQATSMGRDALEERCHEIGGQTRWGFEDGEHKTIFPTASLHGEYDALNSALDDLYRGRNIRTSEPSHPYRVKPRRAPVRESLNGMDDAKFALPQDAVQRILTRDHEAHVEEETGWARPRFANSPSTEIER